MTCSENTNNDDEKSNSLQNSSFSSNSAKHKNNHLNNRRNNSTFISSCFSFSVAALIISLFIAFFSLQYYLPKAAILLDQCPCIKNELNGRLYNSSSIGYPKHLPDGRIQYEIVVVSDLDHDSKFDGKKKHLEKFCKTWTFIFSSRIVNCPNPVE